MPTNAELAAKLLRNAAEFFRSVAEQNSELDEQMRSNADTYDRVAEWVEKDANGEGRAQTGFDSPRRSDGRHEVKDQAEDAGGRHRRDGHQG